MIECKTGDLFTEDAEAIVNTVNCVGVMGAGLALQFKKRFPGNFTAYADACARQAVKPGQMFIHDLGGGAHPRYIVNFPTKRHWQDGSHFADITQGLDALASDIQHLAIRSIAIPPLGCGLGGLNWAEVKPCIESALGGLEDVRVIIFEPI